MAKKTDPFATDTVADIGGLDGMPSGVDAQVPRGPGPMDDPEVAAVKAGRMAPYQVTSPTARAEAYDWYRRDRYQPKLRGPASGYQQGDAMGQWNTTMAANASVAGDVPTTAPQLWDQGGFADPQSGQAIEAVRGGLMRPDEVQNPTVRAAIMRMLQNDVAFADDFRRNRASQLRGVGRRADPDVMAAAQAEIDATKGTGVPSLANEAEANGMSIPQYLRSGASSYGDGEEAERVAAAFEARQARREAEKNRRTANGVRSVIEDNAKRIARVPPEKWADEIARFNRRAQRAGMSEKGMFITPEDIARAGARRYRPMGIEGTAPPIVGGMDGRPPSSGGRRQGGSVIQTPMGSYRPEMIDGKPVGVPVIEMQGGSVPNPMGQNVTRESWESMYTAQDAGLTRRAITSLGMTDWSLRQRAIDAARASLTDGSFLPQEVAQARLELQRRENELHYEWLMAEGANAGLDMPSGQSQLDLTDPKEAEAKRKAVAEENDIAQKYKDEYGLDDEQARVAARNRYTPDAPLVTKRPKETEEKPKDRKPVFDTDGFYSEYERQLKSLTRPSGGGQSPVWDTDPLSGNGAPAEVTPEQRNAAFRTALRRKPVSQIAVRRSFQEGMREIMQDPSLTSAYGESVIRDQIASLVLSHLPMFADAMNDPDDTKAIDRIVDGYMPKSRRNTTQ